MPSSSPLATRLLALATAALAAGACTATQRHHGASGTTGQEQKAASAPKREEIVPLVDHHQHLVSPATAAMIGARQRPGSPPQGPITADTLVRLLDLAGIRRAVVLSGAFTMGGRNFDDRRGRLTDEELMAEVRAENDWTAREVARHPERLVAFCSFHPQVPGALDELRRCDANPVFVGVKLHLEESDVRLTDSLQLETVRAVFAEANRRRLPIVVHVSNNRADAAATARAFVRNVLPAAPDVPVQVAHLHGGGAYSDGALAVYAEAVEAKVPATRRLLFDVTDIARTGSGAGARGDSARARIVGLMRRIGMERMLYGSDPAVFGRLAPREGWAEFRAAMPLTDAEVATIARNVAPYLTVPRATGR